MSLRATSLREAELILRIDQLKKELKDVRAATQKALEKAHEETGTRQISVTLPDGERVGTISFNEDTKRAEITDEHSFREWVSQHYPSEIERKFVAEIRPAFASNLLTRMTKANAARITDAETGEIHDVPGVEIRTTRTGGHTLRFRNDEAKEAVRAAFPAG
ncbi:hypothetical protein QNO07_26040 [Streptomyces sp. 549]|uniref:hypothetical protein n=1 Tax=Streptomyces sp. 549 TaxID=3049076 RepID=UPI0024C31973|nr:hypothetical protein [Streptomyces sp. 549]MDK1476821.1 hypothetical protein [Streptomyces sp. 549]